MSKIPVTAEHIHTAVQRDSHHCMVADAIRDRFGAQYVLVDVQTIRFTDRERKERYCYLTPPIAQQAVIAFDQGKRVKPFAFTLGAPIKVRAVRRTQPNSPAKQRARRKYRRTGKRSTTMNIAAREREFGVRKLQA